MTSTVRRRLFVYTLVVGALGVGGLYFFKALDAERRQGHPFSNADFHRPQEPRKPYPYLAEEVVVQNADAKIVLAGTLTRPKGIGPYPAVVLIQGTGPHDRDGSGSGHRPFLVLADHLTRHGIAVLRCDRRGAGKSSGNFEAATQADFANDALAAAAYLRTRKEIDTRRIGLIGHSEGGVIAMTACGKSSDLAFLILLASPGLPLADVTARQHHDAARAFEIDRPLIENWITTHREFFRIVSVSGDQFTTEQSVRQLWAKRVVPLTDKERQTLGIQHGALDVLLNQARQPGFISAVRADPRKLLASVKCPVLALNGAKDVQVSAEENLPAIEAALAAAGNRQVETITLPRLNHGFQTAKTGLVAEYQEIEETLAPEAMELISDWILALNKGH